MAEDRRPDAKRAEQSVKLIQAEELAILSACNQNQYRSSQKAQILSSLADKGVSPAPESSCYRTLKKHQQQNYRGRVKPARKAPEPTSFTETGPSQMWSRDISYCPSLARGQDCYLYLIIDVYSWKIVAGEIHGFESGEQAKQLVERVLMGEGCCRLVQSAGTSL